MTVGISVRHGAEVRSLVDPFYEKYGSKGRARDTDLFFLATLDSKLVGCVRYCVEEATPMLRTMMIAEEYRRQRIGHQLLAAFAKHLDQEGIHDVFCLPYSHLENFYGSIGFIKASPPAFLQERLNTYHSNSLSQYICMRRP